MIGRAEKLTGRLGGMKGALPSLSLRRPVNWRLRTDLEAAVEGRECLGRRWGIATVALAAGVESLDWLTGRTMDFWTDMKWKVWTRMQYVGDDPQCHVS